VADEEAGQAQQGLDEGQLDDEAVLAQGAAPDEPEVDDGQVGRLDKKARLVVGDEAHEAQTGGEAEGPGDGGHGLAVWRPDGDGGLEQTGAGVEAREAMAGAGDEAEDLGRRVDEVEDLGEQHQHQRLAEVAQDAHDDEDHAGEVAVRVAHEDARRVPVVAEQGGRHAQEGQQEVETEEVRVGGRVRVRGEQVQAVVEHQEERHHHGLGHLDAVDAGQDVYAVGREDGHARHVDVVEGAQVEELAQVGLQRDGDHDRRHAEVDKVDDQQRDGGEGRDEELVPPPDVEEVVAYAQEGDGLEGDDG